MDLKLWKTHLDTYLFFKKIDSHTYAVLLKAKCLKNRIRGPKIWNILETTKYFSEYLEKAEGEINKRE